MDEAMSARLLPASNAYRRYCAAIGFSHWSELPPHGRDKLVEAIWTATGYRRIHTESVASWRGTGAPDHPNRALARAVVSWLRSESARLDPPWHAALEIDLNVGGGSRRRRGADAPDFSPENWIGLQIQKQCPPGTEWDDGIGDCVINVTAHGEKTPGVPGKPPADPPKPPGKTTPGGPPVPDGPPPPWADSDCKECLDGVNDAKMSCDKLCNQTWGLLLGMDPFFDTVATVFLEFCENQCYYAHQKALHGCFEECAENPPGGGGAPGTSNVIQCELYNCTNGANGGPHTCYYDCTDNTSCSKATYGSGDCTEDPPLGCKTPLAKHECSN
ncbi:MAG: hypothetical protein WKG00_34890 [Polyangiaceae bacterium]